MDVSSEAEEVILVVDVSDDALETAAGTESGRANFTWGYCTANQPGCPG